MVSGLFLKEGCLIASGSVVGNVAWGGEPEPNSTMSWNSFVRAFDPDSLREGTGYPVRGRAARSTVMSASTVGGVLTVGIISGEMSIGRERVGVKGRHVLLVTVLPPPQCLP